MSKYNALPQSKKGCVEANLMRHDPEGKGSKTKDVSIEAPVCAFLVELHRAHLGAASVWA